MKKSFLDVGRVNSERLFARRFILLLTALSILSLLLITRLYYLQVMSYEHFDTLSETNRIKYIPTPPRRGIIYDRNNVELLINKRGLFKCCYDANLSRLDTITLHKIPQGRN